MKPDIPGIDKSHVHFSYLADEGAVPVGMNVVVIGAGVVGLESALHLAREGHKVTVLEFKAREDIRDITARARLPLLLSETGKAEILYRVIVEEIRDHSVVCRDRVTCRTFELSCDTVLVAAGLRPRREVYDALLSQQRGQRKYIFMIGDVKSPLNRPCGQRCL